MPRLVASTPATATPVENSTAVRAPLIERSAAVRAPRPIVANVSRVVFVIISFFSEANAANASMRRARRRKALPTRVSGSSTTDDLASLFSWGGLFLLGHPSVPPDHSINSRCRRMGCLFRLIFP